MKVIELHDWDVAPSTAVTLQNSLRDQLISDEPIVPANIRFIAGVDVSVKDQVSQAAVVVLTYPDLQLVETVRTQHPTHYPYIPGLLTFREGLVLVEAFKKLQYEPDIFVFDGMGQIHPRRMGIAAHLGLWLNRPTIGIGKTHFLGTFDPVGNERGNYSDLWLKGERLGAVLRTRTNVKPVYVSVGHRAELKSAIDFTLTITPKYRLPQPIRLAHDAAGQYDQSDDSD